MNDAFKINNFDLIRLFAALQVVVHHSMTHFGVNTNSAFYELSNILPGVPIFFFISGFLISKSYEKNHALVEYAQNRVLRIFPALIVCTLFAVGSVYITGYFSDKHISLIKMLIWILGQISFAQSYNPDFMRSYGSGVLNGSLWTITVELQFYILIPIIYWLFNLRKPLGSNIKIIGLILFFMSINILNNCMFATFKHNIIYKFSGITFFPWIYMFLIGTLFQKNFTMLHRLLSGKALHLLILYFITSFIAFYYLHMRIGNNIGPLLYLILACFIFSCAYTYPQLSVKILKGNDISYGVYIYHMPIINLLIYYNFTSSINCMFIAVLTTILCAILSWIIVEKPSLALKKHPLNPLNRKKTIGNLKRALTRTL